MCDKVSWTLLCMTVIFFIFIVIKILSGHSGMPVKEFLFKYPQYEIQIDNSPFFNKNISQNEQSKYMHGIGNFIIRINDINKKYTKEVFISNRENRKFPGTNILVMPSDGWGSRLRFKIVEQTKKNKIEKENQIKKEYIMSLPISTWILIIMMMFAVAKIAHKVTLKLFFKPTKQAVEQIKKEWNES